MMTYLGEGEGRRETRGERKRERRGEERRGGRGERRGGQSCTCRGDNQNGHLPKIQIRTRTLPALPPILSPLPPSLLYPLSSPFLPMHQHYAWNDHSPSTLLLPYQHYARQE
jgi:hypothetical protein